MAGEADVLAERILDCPPVPVLRLSPISNDDCVAKRAQDVQVVPLSAAQFAKAPSLRLLCSQSMLAKQKDRT